jgi:hypothetical protein
MTQPRKGRKGIPMYYDAHALRITAAEAVEKADICCLLSDMQISHEIYTAFIPRIRGAAPGRDSWEWYCLFGTIFFAGRVQGVREERARRREIAARKAARSGIRERGPRSDG